MCISGKKEATKEKNGHGTRWVSQELMQDLRKPARAVYHGSSACDNPLDTVMRSNVAWGHLQD